MKFSLYMKPKLILLIPALLLAFGVHAQSLFTNTYSQTVNTLVLDDNPNGLSSTLNVSGVPGIIQSISVNLLVTNGFAGDYYAYLVDPAGDKAVLLNRVGVSGSNPFGYSDSGFNISLDSAAANNIHFYQSGSYTLDANGLLTGTWQADGRNIDPESTPSAFDSAPTTSGLNLDPGTNPNGDWTLFIADMSGGYEGTLVDWSLTVVTVPEPTTGQLLALAAIVGICIGLNRRSKKNG